MFIFLQTPYAMENADDPAACQYLGRLLDGFPIHGLCRNDAAGGRTMTSCYVEKANGDGVLDNETDYEYDAAAFEAGECDLDEGNGFTFENGTRIVVTTENYPYVPIGTMSNSVATACGLQF